MKTDFIVTITTGRHPEPQTTKGHHETFDLALEEAHTYSRHILMAPSIITVWARQGRHVWPVRILYPSIPLSGVPDPSPDNFPTYYMVDTKHPLSTVYLHDEMDRS
mgnify:CR=1 FL=1